MMRHVGSKPLFACWPFALTLAASQLRPSLSFSTANSFLRDPTLVSFDNSKNVPTFPVYNPASPDETVGRVPLWTRSDVKDAIDRSSLAWWRDETTASYRASLLTKWSQLIQENKEDIATIMTLEAGKPLAESRGEVMYAASFLDYYAAEALRPTNAGGGFLSPTMFSNPDGSPRGQIVALQQAVGVTGLITPWNFPLAMITRKVGPALAAGCTAIVKPSELTPLTALAAQNLAERAGIPPGVLQCVTTDAAHTPEVGEELCTNPIVQKISFTGSTAVGKLLMKQSSGTTKKLSLELGGNAPFVVFDDASIDQAVASAVASKYRNAGQTCVCADRFLIHSSLHDAFVEKLTAKAKGFVVGAGMDETTTIGPLISAHAANNVHQKVQDAIAEGATRVWGGSKMPSLGPHFMEPTILTNVDTRSSVWNTETFGPVAAIRSFDDEEEALAIANDSRVGLAAYFCTNDLSRAFRFAKNLECGIVGVNDGIISTCTAPFGGVKESGLGREGGAAGLAEYLETKYVFLNC